MRSGGQECVYGVKEEEEGGAHQGEHGHAVPEVEVCGLSMSGGMSAAFPASAS